MIEETIEREITSGPQQDGGDLELIDVVGNRVLVSDPGGLRLLRRASHDPQGLRGGQAQGIGRT